MGGRLKREGICTCVCIWLICFVVQQKLKQYCEAIINKDLFKKYIVTVFQLMVRVSISGITNCAGYILFPKHKEMK